MLAGAHATFIESTAAMQIASQATTAAVRSPPQARLTCWMLQMAFSEAAPQLSIWTASAENASWVSVVMSFSHVVQKAASSCDSSQRGGYRTDQPQPPALCARAESACGNPPAPLA